MSLDEGLSWRYYAINEELNLVYVKADGVLTRDEMVGFEAAFIADQRARPGFKALFDASLVRVADFDSNLPVIMLAMERKHPERFVGCKRALLFTEEMGWSNAKHFASAADGNLIVLFSVDVALVWLGVTMDDLPRLEE